MTKTRTKQLVVCVENDGYAASLEKRKIYVAMRDAVAEKHHMLRIVDESGEDYLYPKAFFRRLRCRRRSNGRYWRRNSWMGKPSGRAFSLPTRRQALYRK